MCLVLLDDFVKLLNQLCCIAAILSYFLAYYVSCLERDVPISPKLSLQSDTQSVNKTIHRLFLFQNTISPSHEKYTLTINATSVLFSPHWSNTPHNVSFILFVGFFMKNNYDIIIVVLATKTKMHLWISFLFLYLKMKVCVLCVQSWIDRRVIINTSSICDPRL